MGDVVSVEVDGEPGEPRFDTNRSRPAWGMPVAVVVVGALLLGLGWTILRSSDGSTTPSAGPIVSTPTTARGGSTSTEPPLVQRGASTVPAAQTATTVPSPDMDDPVEAARVALAAWGEFAGTGDLTVVRRLFSADGPQLAQLEGEAGSIAPPAGPSAPRYQVTLTDPRPKVGPGTATVTGTVVWAHLAEPDQAYHWAIEMHKAADDTWQLFTVRTVDA